jgi:hypothetical protein
VADIGEEAPANLKSLEAHYANYFEIGFNLHELVMDFGQFYEPNATPTLHTRIVTSPAYATALLELLGNVLAELNRKFKTLD